MNLHHRIHAGAALASLLALGCSSAVTPATVETPLGAKTGRMDAPGISIGQPTRTRVELIVCGGFVTGAPAGFSVQWAPRDGRTLVDWDAEGACEASFSGNASSSRYTLAPGACVTVDVGELRLDSGASTSCGEPLACGGTYAFRAFAHATSTSFRSGFAEATGVTLPCADAPAYQGVFVPTGGRAALRSAPFSVGLADGRVLVAGGRGCGPIGGVCGDAEIYDLATGTFEVTGRLLVPRIHAEATLLADGRVLVTGGESELGPVSSAELYDPATGVFTSAGDMNVARAQHTATRLADGRVLLAGSIDFSAFPRTAVGSAEIYDPATGQFTLTGSLAQPRYYHTATLLPDGRVLLAGGNARGVPLRTAESAPLSSTEIYDPATGIFAAGASLGAERCFHTATLLPDGKVLVAGGYAGQTAELYDPATGFITPAAGSMGMERFTHSATLLRDGKVLLAGGTDHTLTATATAELFDPSNGTFGATGSMSTARGGPRAEPLPGGQVLVVDGNTAGADAELFR